MNYCIQCGARVDAGGAFCTSCGARMGASQAAAPGPVEPTQPAQANPELKKSGPSGFGKVVLWVLILFVVFAALGVTGVVYVGRRVAGKVSDFSKTGDPASPKETSQNQAEQKSGNSGQSKSDNDRVSKALDGIGGIMDRMGFGDPPPNPYADLPVAKSGEITKNLCPSADTATEVPPPTGSDIGPSGIAMRQGLMIIHAWGRKAGDTESINSVTKVTDQYVEISNVGTFFKRRTTSRATPERMLATSALKIYKRRAA